MIVQHFTFFTAHTAKVWFLPPFVLCLFIVPCFHFDLSTQGLMRGFQCDLWGKLHVVHYYYSLKQGDIVTQQLTLELKLENNKCPGCYACI